MRLPARVKAELRAGKQGKAVREYIEKVSHCYNILLLYVSRHPMLEILFVWSQWCALMVCVCGIFRQISAQFLSNAAVMKLSANILKLWTKMNLVLWNFAKLEDGYQR